MVAFIWRGRAPGSTTASIGATASQATGSPSTRSAARAQAGDPPLQSATVTFIWPGRALAAAVQISEALAQTTTSTGRPLIDWKPAGAELLRTAAETVVNRGDWIRTSDLPAPSRMRYQTAPRPVTRSLGAGAFERSGWRESNPRR